MLYNNYYYYHVMTSVAVHVRACMRILCIYDMHDMICQQFRGYVDLHIGRFTWDLRLTVENNSLLSFYVC